MRLDNDSSNNFHSDRQKCHHFVLVTFCFVYKHSYCPGDCNNGANYTNTSKKLVRNENHFNHILLIISYFLQMAPKITNTWEEMTDFERSAFYCLTQTCKKRQEVIVAMTSEIHYHLKTKYKQYCTN